MSTKLVINKFEDGRNFKSLYVTIPAEESTADITFSEWMEGIIQHKKSYTEKSSRLVVKIISGEESKKIELDSCAKELVDLDIYLNHYNNNITQNTATDNTINSCNAEIISPTTYLNQLTTPDPKTINQNFEFDFANPLEQSLQKVKENNAKIMENIHILNRTLNYTKKKEIMDIICSKSMKTYPCDVCGKCFVYESGLRRHYLIRHAIVGVQPRWQVVYTCIQCFQIWPQQELAMEHSTECCKVMLDKNDCVREIKTSLLLQCEFCEKVFTSIPRLLRHSKIHSTVNNYECNPCGLAFVSYKTAEQHWTSCPWLKTKYSFSLPRMLLCNACDRKFRSYEQLYNHRYKVGHFMPKTHLNIGNNEPFTLAILVYQCELCGQWCNSISDMTSHRSLHHPRSDSPKSTKTVCIVFCTFILFLRVVLSNKF